jgi:hypothetical protein
MQLTTGDRSRNIFPQRGNPAGASAPTRWSPLVWTALLAALTVATLLIQGFHPLAEDGGLYAAGVEWTLDPSLFPHFTEFVSEHLRFSIFAPFVADLVRLTHVPLLTLLFVLNLASIALMLTAALALLRRVTRNQHAQLAGIATLAALWTVPVAGTSLLLMDPYVTARSFSTPLSLWAIAFALDDWKDNRRALIGCIAIIVLAAAFHPLMAGYAVGLVVILRVLRSRHRILLLSAFAILTLAASAILQARAPADSPAELLAVHSRYYWFLAQWHWYELFGLTGPLLVLLALNRLRPALLSDSARSLALGCILYGCFAAAMGLVFAHESYHAHIIARLQPLRAFLTIYAVMLLLLGTSIQQLFEVVATRSPALRITRFAILPILLAAAFGMHLAQRDAFPASNHVELPWRAQSNPNPWVQAFLWSRDNTPRNALFAMNAHYITTHGEDAQTFRAIAERSALPDFSKDGGEAAITPRLADEWASGFTAQLNVDDMSAPRLRARLISYQLNWVILQSSSPAALDCPYNNGTLKVCSLQP